jgi:hypothetical protein
MMNKPIVTQLFVFTSLFKSKVGLTLSIAGMRALQQKVPSQGPDQDPPGQTHLRGRSGAAQVTAEAAFHEVSCLFA